MASLNLGNFSLSHHRALVLPELKAVALAGLFEALNIGISAGLRRVVENTDQIIEKEKPEILLLIGEVSTVSLLAAAQRRWGEKCKLMLVSHRLASDIRSFADSHGIEWHRELVWGNLRFVESEDPNTLDLNIFTVAAKPNFHIRIEAQNHPFSGGKHPVFLKGMGKIWMPTQHPTQLGQSVFTEHYNRCDVFAVGHHRVIPMGKVETLRALRRPIVGDVPVKKIRNRTLGLEPKNQKSS